MTEFPDESTADPLSLSPKTINTPQYKRTIFCTSYVKIVQCKA